ncbi:MAG TPA: DUF4276 family protein [Thermoanaerobaculia bacterium]|nr:DUF4276 family protein [Thermoanaerobaculia bacterium]
MKPIQIFVEGGGSTVKTKSQLRSGLRDFLERAGFVCRVIACGRRDAAFKYWRTALSVDPEALNFLLVDSEGPVEKGSLPWRHLGKSDPSWQPPADTEDHCHLMVQMMEAWFLADPEALAAYYGHHFGASALPGRPNVEEIPKGDVERALKAATQRTQKGEYHKIRHAFDLLALIDPEKVRKRAPHCERLLATLASARA